MERSTPQADPHHITDIVVWDLGPIDLLKLQPERDWTVFHGRNSTGKTTIIDALESALAARPRDADAPSRGADQPLRHSQLRRGKTEGGIVVMTGDRRSWTRTITDEGDRKMVLATAASPGGDAPWARFGRNGIDPLRPDRERLRSQRVEALAAGGTARRRAAIAALECVRGTAISEHGTGHECSDAEEQLLEVFVGLAARLESAWSDAANALERPAICLFDDIDRHLHPETQQRVLPALAATFPRTQFIGTTHSPVVLTTLHPRQITRLARSAGNGPVERRGDAGKG